MITLIIFFMLCLVLSAFFSGTEMAFVSANKVKLRELAENGNRAAQKIVRLYDQTDQFLTSLLMGNNIVNVAATAILTYAFHIYFGIESEWLVTLVMAPILIIFGEIVPKDYCRLQGHHFLLSASWLVHFFSGFFNRPARLILGLIRFLLGSRRFATRKSIFVSEEEFRGLIEESTQSGILEPHEEQMIKTILDLERIRVESVMIPLEQVAKVDITGTIRDIKRVARQTKNNMVLVYEEIPSIVVGMIYVFDLLFEENEDQSLKRFLRSPIFVPRSVSVEKAFLTLQEKRQSYAVVTETWGDVVGIVSIEQLVMV